MRRHAGYMLIEMSAAIVLLSVVGLLAAQFTINALGLSKQIEHRRAVQGELGYFLEELREDVWGAAAMQVEGDELTLTFDDADAVVWRFQVERTEQLSPHAGPGEERQTRAIRARNGDEQRVYELALPVGMEPGPVGVEVDVAGERVHLASQRSMAEGGGR